MNRQSYMEYEVYTTKNSKEACYYIHPSNGNWKSGNALTTSLPFLLLQLFVVLLCDGIVLFILKPLYQPQIVAHMICGIILGPTVFGDTHIFKEYIIPYKSAMVLETFANLALMYYMFLVGLEMDFSLIIRSGSKAVSIAMTGILLSFAVGYGLFLLFISKSLTFGDGGSMFWATFLTCTNFPELARILADLKLLRSDIGRISMCSASISDLCSWALLVVAISILNARDYYALLSTFIFVLICIFACRPALSWIISHTTKGEGITEDHVWFILAGAMLCGFITDGCGSHSIVGAFMFGAIMPQGDFIKSTLINKLDYFVTGILMPLFFLTNGLRLDIKFMIQITSWKTVLLVIVISCGAKITSTFLVSLFYKMPPQEGLALGLLMNTKGVLALIIINTGRNIKALDNQTFPLMALTLLVMTSLVEPIIAFTYKPTKQVLEYKNRTIQRANPNANLRIVACVHSTQDVLGILRLLELSHSTKESPLHIFAVHLLQLTGRARTAMLIVHDENKPGGVNNRSKTETGQIVKAFENFGERSNATTIETITAVSPYETMHIDICILAEDKRVNLIILPFHKNLDSDGRMGNASSTFADVNHNVFLNAPCSVGVLVDRGLGSKRADSQHGSHAEVTQHIIMLFIGGPDDREALAYAWRMAGYPGVRLTVVRFLPGKYTVESNLQDSAIITNERESQIDGECIYEFKFKSIHNSSTSYIEKVVNSGEEILAAIKGMGSSYDLYIVGRGQGVKSPLISGISDWNTFSELGIIGDALRSSSFALHASILVVQQYVPLDASTISEDPSTWKLRTTSNDSDVVSFVNRQILDDSDEAEDYTHGE